MRLISLLNKIKIEKNCEHIRISDHYYTCVKDCNTESIRSSLAEKPDKFTNLLLVRLIKL